MNGRCQVCDADAQVREAVEALLNKRVSLRKIQKQSGFDKSVLSRHGSHTINPLLERHRQSRLGKGKFARVITKWFDPRMFLQQSAGHDTNAEPVTIAESQLKANDVVVRIELTASAVRNPAALQSASRFLSALAAETNPKPVETTQDTAEPSLPDPAETIAPVPIAREQSQPEKAVEPENNCSHEMHKVSGDIERCIHCGHQEQPFTVKGFTHEEYASGDWRKGRR